MLDYNNILTEILIEFNTSEYYEGFEHFINSGRKKELPVPATKI